jgi:hypothetical protein
MASALNESVFCLAVRIQRMRFNPIVANVRGTRTDPPPRITLLARDHHVVLVCRTFRAVGWTRTGTGTGPADHQYQSLSA